MLRNSIGETNKRRHGMRPLVCLLLCWIHASATFALDKVTIRSDRNDVGQELSGRIVAYDREQLVLQNGDQQRMIPTATIIGIETDWGPSYIRAQKFADSGEWDKAIESYSTARQRERRVWAQQQILRDLALAYKMRGDIERAGNIALALVMDYPQTRALDALPLSWTGDPPGPAFTRQAHVWLTNGRSAAARLLGASWLLSGPSRSQALRVLKELSRDSEPWVAQLAETQLWRTSLVQVTATECRRWEKMIKRMPWSLRAGPLYVLGQAWRREHEYQRAALTFMRIPVLHADQGSLAVEALMATADALSQADEERSAARVYREIVTQYPYSKHADTAGRLLANITQKTPGD
jgi:outer membrane protein assembly factor BamD (BamD/ComL family)